MNHDRGRLNPIGNSRQPTVFIETYGCQMNIADSLLIGGILESVGYRRVSDPKRADVILMNTCAVRDHAETRVIGRLNQLKSLKDRKSSVLLGVCGCLAEHLKTGLVERAPWVDLLAGPDAYRRLPALLERASQGTPVVDLRLDRRETYDGIPSFEIDGITGWLTVQRGCDRFCSFCVVPYVRGRERSCPPRQVLREARMLAQQGAREITLLGQRVNAYSYEQTDLADLLQAIALLDGVKRLRLTSPYPLGFTDKLIHTIATHPKVMPYLHLPLQSGSDPVLTRMQRGYDVQSYVALVQAIREAIPGIGLSTDLIVGFPGETEEDYERTLSLVETIRFDQAFMFYYSHRTGTLAHRRLDDDVPIRVKKRRLSRLITLQERIGGEVNREYRGRTVEVLTLGPSRRNASQWMGKTDTFKTTVFSAEKIPVEVGGLVSVKILSTTSHTLMGRAVDVIDQG